MLVLLLQFLDYIVMFFFLFFLYLIIIIALTKANFVLFLFFFILDWVDRSFLRERKGTKRGHGT